MLTTLMRLEKHPASSIERYFQSHPDPAKRVRDVHSKLQEIAKLLVVNQGERFLILSGRDQLLASALGRFFQVRQRRFAAKKSNETRGGKVSQSPPDVQPETGLYWAVTRCEASN